MVNRKTLRAGRVGCKRKSQRIGLTVWTVAKALADPTASGESVNPKDEKGYRRGEAREDAEFVSTDASLRRAPVPAVHYPSARRRTRGTSG